MKKRSLSFLLALIMLLALFPFGALAAGNPDCFPFIKNYLMDNGVHANGVYTYQCSETTAGDDGQELPIEFVFTYDPKTETLTFGDRTQRDPVAYAAEVVVPSTLKMPYDAAQHFSALGMQYDNAGKLSSDFTTKSEVALSGETFGTESLFPYTIALALRHLQETVLDGSGYTIADLGFTALFEELYPNGVPTPGEKPCDGGANCPSRVFTDVVRSGWYHIPMDWAVTTGVTTGLKPDLFGPNDSCTRAQMVTFIWRAMNKPEPTRTDSSFVDVPAGQYYAKAVLWALENGITTGTDAKHFSPDATVTRAQTVTFLWRLKHQPAPTGSASFPDVPAKAYYAAAVMWAVENKITNGTGQGLFEPESNCTRAQIVTFLHRTIVGVS